MLKNRLKYEKGDRVIVLSPKKVLNEQVDNVFWKIYGGIVLEIVDKQEYSYIGSNGKQRFKIYESDIVSKTLT